MKRRTGDQGGSDPKKPRTGAREDVEPVAEESLSTTASASSADKEPQRASNEVTRGEQGHADPSTDNRDGMSGKSSGQAGSAGGSGAIGNRARSPEWVVSPSGAHYSQSFIKRLDNFFNFAEDETKRFYLSKAPKKLNWGTGQWQRFLCVAEQPVLFWMVCELTKDYFLCAPGCNPAKSVSATVGMLRDSDLVCARRLLRDHQRYTPETSPSKDTSKQKETDTVRLSNKTSSLTRTKQTVTWLFEDIFDGRSDFDRKDAMSRMRPDEVGTGDVLLAECYITRYHCDVEGKAVYERAFETLRWDRWRTGFDMKYLTVLRSGEDVSMTAMPSVDDSNTKRM